MIGLLQPWWLVLLGPWVGLVILALRQFRPKVLVTYLDLWPQEAPQDVEKRRGWRPPAWPVAMLLLATLLGVLALGRPVWESRRPTLTKVTIIVDRGVTMLAGGRARQVADRALRILSPLLADESEIRVIDTPGGDRIVPRGQLGEVLGRPATAVDTRQRVKALVEAAEMEGRPTVLLSDLSDVGANVAQIAPKGAVRDVGIVRAAVAGGQCLVEIRNDTDRAEVTVEMAGGSHRVELPPRGQTRQYVLPASAGIVHVHLDVADNLADDNDWWIFPGGASPRLEVSASVSAEVKRFAAAYTAARARQEAEGVTVRIVPPGEAAAERCVIVAPADRMVSVPQLQVDHPILRNVRLPEQVMATSSPLPAGEWKPVLSGDGVTLLAVDETQRRVWVGVELPQESAEQVLLWTNIVEFAGGMKPANYAPRLLDESWVREGEALPAEVNGLRAGLYRRAGEVAAVCVPAPVFAALPASPPNGDRLLAMAQRSSQVPLFAYLWVMVMAAVGGAVIMMRNSDLHRLPIMER